MSEVLAEPHEVNNVNLNLQADFSHPCLLYGLSKVVQTRDPDAARGHFVTQLHYELENNDDAVIPATLHCGSKALSECHASAEGVVSNYMHTGVEPSTATFTEDAAALAHMPCPHRKWLERVYGIASAAT